MECHSLKALRICKFRTDPYVDIISVWRWAFLEFHTSRNIDHTAVTTLEDHSSLLKPLCVGKASMYIA
eukprot:1140492-Ditylum_brightwellii.AAC.1